MTEDLDTDPGAALRGQGPYPCSQCIRGQCSYPQACFRAEPDRDGGTSWVKLYVLAVIAAAALAVIFH